MRVKVKCSNSWCPKKGECIRWAAEPVMYQTYLCYDVLITQHGPWCGDFVSLEDVEAASICSFRRPFWKDNKQREKELHAITNGKCHRTYDPPRTENKPDCAVCGNTVSDDDSVCDPCHHELMHAQRQSWVGGKNEEVH